MQEENKPKTILVADDEVETLEHLVHTLKRINCRVISTTKGRDVVRMAKAEKPDLIILDVVMPDMDGGQVASILADTPQTAADTGNFFDRYSYQGGRFWPRDFR